MNEDTVFQTVEEVGEPPDFRAGFERHYTTIRQRCQQSSAPGLAVVALDWQRVVEVAWLRGDPDALCPMIIGRHEQADLRLPDEHLSLRHLAVLLYPAAGADDVRFRVADLRSATGFTDERGQRLQAVEAEGAMFLHCGSYALLFLPTGPDAMAWTEDAADAWARIPERVFLHEAPADPDSRRRRRRARRSGLERVATHEGFAEDRPTIVQAMPGPRHLHRELLGEDERPVGELIVESPSGAATLVVGKAALLRGVLLGRSSRCDTTESRVLSGHRVSRVHVLLIELEGQLHLIDVASTNGTVIEEEEIRCRRLEQRLTFCLAEDNIQVTWQPGPSA